MSRCGDITIGDFWGIENIDPEFSDNAGVSLVFANTTKGAEIINEISKVLEHRIYSSRVAIQPNLHRPSEVGMDYKKFWRLYKKRGYMAIRERFAKGGKRYFLYLCAFLDHGEIEISNNQVENAIRPIVVGRKNWLFCDTQAGASASVIIFTLLETAKSNGLNPETYLSHLLTVLPERYASDSQDSIDDLMPWAEEIQKKFRA